MNLVTRKINALLILMFYAIGLFLFFSGHYNDYPVIKTHRSDLLGSIVMYYLTYVIVFSFLTPKLKTKYQLTLSLALTCVAIFFINNYVSTQIIIGIILGMLTHIGLFIYESFKTIQTEK